MNGNLGRKLEKAISGMNRTDLNNIIKNAKNSGILNKLSANDKQKIISEFSKLSSDQMRKKLSEIKTSDLSKLNSKDILDKIKKL